MVSAGVKGQHELLLLWSLCVSCLLPGMVNAECARLEFPTASKMTSLGEVPFVAVPVNQTAHIPFSVNLSSCEHSTASSITMVVAKMGKDNILKEQCKLSGHGQMYGAESCRISNHKGNYSWSKHIDRSDHTYWRWKATFSGKELIRYIRLDVTYPPTLTGLSSLPPSPVQPGSSVSLLCRYEKGNPDVSPFITGPKGRKLEAHQPRPGEMMHWVEKVSCEDTGNYSCQAPAASSNQTLTLLVKCPLKFTEQMRKMFVVEAYKESRLTFPFRSYTPHLTHCWIVPWSGDSSQSPPTSVLHNKPVNCSSITTVDKTPPAMILTLTLYNVTSHHQGSWNLTVGNDVGSDSVIFDISVSNLPGPVTSKSTQTTVVSLESVTSSSTTGPQTHREPSSESMTAEDYDRHDGDDHDDHDNDRDDDGGDDGHDDDDDDHDHVHSDDDDRTGHASSNGGTEGPAAAAAVVMSAMPVIIIAVLA